MNDADLVRAARSGDIAAVGALIERYRAQMMAVAVSLLGNHPDTEDVVQDACIQALRRIGDVRDPAGVRGWLIAIVANRCHARLRRRPSRTVSMLTDAPSMSLDSAEQILERSAVHDWVQAALDRLPPTAADGGPAAVFQRRVRVPDDRRVVRRARRDRP